MNATQAKSRIQALVRDIDAHNQRYYVKDDPTVSDAEYDALMRELVELEVQFPQFKSADSPTQRVGAKIEGDLPPVVHQFKMMSLDNTYSIDELKLWDGRVKKGLHGEHYDLVAELKIDGASCALTYIDGVLTLGATRGDGETGENVTHNVKTMRDVPLRLKGKFPKVLEVRGEVYMDRKDLAAVNEERREKGEVLFANPRNSAAGALKLLDSRLAAKRKLKFYAHSYGRLEGGVPFESQWEFLQAAKSFGLPVNPYNRLCSTIDEVIETCAAFAKMRESLAGDVDGVVIKVNDLRQHEKLGVTLKSPRWAVAFKFPAYQATSTINAITVQVGRTGVLTPVAELEPVACGGVTISRATLHNFDEIKRLNVNAGDKVLLERAGDVIPKIVKVVDKKTKAPYKIPTECPSCGTKIVKDNDEEVAYRCVNIACPQQLHRALTHFASRTAMDIEGLGDVAVGQLLDRGLLKDISGIYALDKETLLQLELFAEKRADNLLAAIEASKAKPLAKVLYGLGIVNIGAKAAAVLARHFGDIDALMDASLEDVQAVEDMGPVTAASVVSFFKNARNKALIERLRKAGLHLSQPKAAVAGNALAGKKFVFTGELNGMSRQEAGALVEAQGGKVVNSVSRATDYVVVGDAPGSKYNQAQSLGVTILDQKQFMEVVHG